MNKIQTILVDDEPRGLSSLQKLLQLNCPEVEVLACCRSASEAIEKIDLLHPQLIFLDIAMPGKSGFDLLRELGEINFEIIFVTAHNTYMLQAFHFSAVDYLLKPVDDELLAESVQRAQKRMTEKNSALPVQSLLHNTDTKTEPRKMKLCIPSVKGFQVVEIPEIIYCEASANYTNFHFVNRPTICASKPIHEYETLLADCNFIRTHKSTIVNLDHVKEYIRGEGGSLRLSNDKVVEVSRRKKDILMSRMKAYFKF